MNTVDLITAVWWENTHEGKDFSRFSLSSRVTRFDKLRGEKKKKSQDGDCVAQFGRARGSTSTVAKVNVCVCVKWKEAVCVCICMWMGCLLCVIITKGTENDKNTFRYSKIIWYTLIHIAFIHNFDCMLHTIKGCFLRLYYINTHIVSYKWLT